VAGVYGVWTPWTGSRAKAVNATRPESHMERDVPIRGSMIRLGQLLKLAGLIDPAPRSRRSCHTAGGVNEEGGTARPTAWVRVTSFAVGERELR